LSFLLFPEHTSDKLKELEIKTGYSKVYFFLAAVVVFSGSLTLLGGFKLVTDLVGFLYPAYMSFKSMESHKGANGAADDSTQWLTYWVVFSSLALLESVASFLVSWIPMYYAVKTCFIIWLYYPRTLGAEVIYNQVVRPYVLPLLEMAKPSVTTKKAE
jgi:receptor expression-enhancing protein 5/6